MSFKDIVHIKYYQVQLVQSTRTESAWTPILIWSKWAKKELKKCRWESPLRPSTPTSTCKLQQKFKSLFIHWAVSNIQFILCVACFDLLTIRLTYHFDCSNLSAVTCWSSRDSNNAGRSLLRFAVYSNHICIGESSLYSGRRWQCNIVLYKQIADIGSQVKTKYLGKSTLETVS